MYGRGGGGKDTRKGGGREGKDPGKGKEPRGAVPPEVESANAVDAKAKPGAKPKPGHKLNKGTESGLMLQEEAFTVVEQMTYSGSAVRRVPDTMEMSDFFQVPIQSGVETEAELCYSIESVPTSLQKEAAPSAEGPTDLAAFIDKLLATNPNRLLDCRTWMSRAL